MPDVQEKDAKLIQYLNEAYGKERELETALQAHIEMTTRDAYKKRLREHLRETKAQAKGLERRMKKLGGRDAVTDVGNTVAAVASKAVSAAKGPLHAVRGTGEAEKMLKNAKTQFSEEHEEIANYSAIEALAEAVGDKETAQLARGYKREEERMAKFLERLIPQLTREVVKAEVPSGQRARRSTRRRASAPRSSGGSKSRSGSSSSSRPRSGSSRSGSSRSGSSRSGSSRSGSSRSGSSRSGSSRSGR